MDKNLYTKDSIESLSPLEFTRLRPGVYAGDTTYSTQLLVEIISNAVDEFNAGHGNQIDVTIKDSVVSVRDYGQGFIPNSYREDGKTILEAAFSVLNTSGKYRDDGAYEGTSLGSFGIGSKISNFLANWLEVSTWRDNQFEKVKFVEGVFSERESATEKQEANGTLVVWKPSAEFFTHTTVEISKIKELFKTITCLCPGLTINLNDNGKVTTYSSNKGLEDLANEAVKDSEILDDRFVLNYANEKNKIDLVLTYTSNYSSTVVAYVNTGLTERGPHISQIKALLTREFNKFFRDKGWLKEKDENLSGDDLQEGMYIVFNITTSGVSYNAQVKSTVTQLNMAPFNNIIVDSFRQWLEQNEKDARLIAQKALSARKAREAAKKAKEAVRNKEQKKQKVLKFDSKLADCYSKDRTCCELYITEGDSASGNLKTARDNKFQAVMPIRGKIINCQKATISQIQKNAEIMTMIDAFGLSIDPKTMKINYDEKELRYDKIIIMSDADIDGSHIKNLFYTFIWNFCPDLIKEGHIYAGVPPLYKITMGKEYKYLKNDAELKSFQDENKGKKYTVNRLKGLGEMSVSETEETLTDPKGRIIKQITVNDVESANKLFNDLMGNSPVPRKEYIKEHSKEAIGNV